ncbi:MAG: GNAT family N-acetyltransferase [Segetibacter sp.]
MIKLLRTNSENPDFRALVRELDVDLAERDGKDHSFYAQFNKIDAINHSVVAYLDNKPVGCGAIRQYEPGIMEVKRMFTIPQERGKGVASAILSGLEQWAREMACDKYILETGKKQPEAISLYQKRGYKIIKNYGQYENIENSVCMEKDFKK